MKASALKYGILSWVGFLTIFIIVVMPFHAFLSVWASSIVGHYTALRLWKEVLFVVCGVGALYLLATDAKIRTFTLTRRLVWLIGAYIAVLVVTGLVALHGHQVTAKAFGYGLIIDLRFLLFFLITWAVSLRLSRMRSHWQWIVLWPAAIVVIFGLLQVTILPHNFLSHFGYGPDTITPFETINHNDNYIRIASTLRGANPLGAYLVLPISMLSALLFSKKLERRQLALLIAMLICLFFTFSRSAWIGALMSVAVILALSLQTKKSRQIAVSVAAVLVLVGGASLAALRHNDHFENVVFHTQEESAIKTTSNQGHASALREGLHDIKTKPLGGGLGVAGPASAYNHRARIPENYFLQVGQEGGIVALVLFVLINIGVGYLLWLRRSDLLSRSLFASLIGLTIVNLLAQAWADDSLAYIWWGLAGIAMAPNLHEIRKAEKAEHEKS